MNGAQDVCKTIPGLMDNVGRGVRSCDTRQCAMCEALAAMMNKIFSSKGMDSELSGAGRAGGRELWYGRTWGWNAGGWDANQIPMLESWGQEQPD